MSSKKTWKQMSDDLKEMATILIDRIKAEIEEADIEKLVNLLPLFKEIRSTIAMAHRLQLTTEEGVSLDLGEEISLEDLENEMKKLNLANLKEPEEEEPEEEEEEIEEELEEEPEEEPEEEETEEIEEEKPRKKLIQEFLVEWEKKRKAI